MEIKRISILGCGWYGLALAKRLVEAGFLVKGSTTSEEKLTTLKDSQIEPYRIIIEEGKVDGDPTFFDTDVLIISIPPKRNSPSLYDYPEKISAIASRAKEAGIKHVILISSTGVFQDGNFVVDESIVPIPNSVSGKMMLAAEESLTQHSTFSTTIIRFAGLIGPGRNLARHFAGKTGIDNGLAPINLIHLKDCIGLTLAIIKQHAFGKIYHGVSPDHPTRAEFYTKSCLANGFAKPAFTLELLAWKRIESKQVKATLAYDFTIKNWMEWIAIGMAD
jgi:nucleoside-diphosphate-sugar epimerase